MNRTAWRVAVVGAGPVGLALALHGARLMPDASFTVFDARPEGLDVSGDPRTLALSLGSVRFLQRLGAWPGDRAEPIHSVHVSQAPPSPGQPSVLIDAAELGEPQLGAVLSYGALVAPLQAAWLAAVRAEPGRLAMRFGVPVRHIEPVAGEVQVEVDAAAVPDNSIPVRTRHDLVVVAEGGVFAGQARKALAHDYGQTAWVGEVVVEGGTRGRAFERFTRHGPLALLPLLAGRAQGVLPVPSAGASAPGRSIARAAAPGADLASNAHQRLRAALVWCVLGTDDPVRALDAVQRMTVLNTLLPPEAGRVVEISPLKEFALGLNAERTLVRGRIVRIGNAAQTLHPVAGQGLNLGLRDAHALVGALRHTDDIEAALRRVEWTRAPDRWSIIAATDFLARSFTWTLPGLGGLRAAGLAALQALPSAKAALARSMMFGRR